MKQLYLVALSVFFACNILAQKSGKEDSIMKEIFMKDHPDPSQVRPAMSSINKESAITKEYIALTARADSCFFASDYKNAANLYERTFMANYGLGKVGDRYKAATAWTFLNKIDNAFEELNRIVTKGKFKDYDLINNDLSFLSLHADKRWKPLMLLIIENQNE